MTSNTLYLLNAYNLLEFTYFSKTYAKLILTGKARGSNVRSEIHRYLIKSVK